MSIIDQPPAQNSSYGISSAQSGYGAPLGVPPAQQQQSQQQWAPPPSAPQQQQQPPPAQQQPQWQMHYTQEGQPYWVDPATGQSTWDAPR
jgi:WW domain